MIGKTNDSFITEGIDQYNNRLKHYLSIKWVTIPELKEKKNLTPEQVKEKEANHLIASIPKNSFIILLDERGKELRSLEFADFIQRHMNSGVKELVFIIGGAYGISDQLNHLTSHKLALSQMTFTHQFIRLILIEQIYRSMTILRNEPYHNE